MHTCLDQNLLFRMGVQNIVYSKSIQTLYSYFLLGVSLILVIVHTLRIDDIKETNSIYYWHTSASSEELLENWQPATYYL